MYHDSILPATRSNATLFGVMVELTYKCNLDCFFCYNDRQREGVPLSVSQYERLFDDLARMQVLFLDLTGGEPLVHPDFFAIGRAARDRGFAIRVKTGGHGLRGAVARRLRDEVEPLATEISLHGATAATHERQTRVKGSFDLLIEAIPELVELELVPQFVSTLTAWNEGEIDDMFDLADSLGVTLRFQGPVAPRDDGDTGPLAIQPSAAAWPRLMKIQKERTGILPEEMGCGSNTASDGNADPQPFCGTGGQAIHIDPYGNVYPCLHIQWSAGNLHEAGIEEIWTGSKVLAEARALSYRAAERIEREGPMQIFDTPIYCPGLEQKGCACSSRSEAAAADQGLVAIGASMP